MSTNRLTELCSRDSSGLIESSLYIIESQVTTQQYEEIVAWAALQGSHIKEGDEYGSMGGYTLEALISAANNYTHKDPTLTPVSAYIVTADQLRSIHTAFNLVEEIVWFDE